MEQEKQQSLENTKPRLEIWVLDDHVVGGEIVIGWVSSSRTSHGHYISTEHFYTTEDTVEEIIRRQAELKSQPDAIIITSSLNEHLKRQGKTTRFNYGHEVIRHLKELFNQLNLDIILIAGSQNEQENQLMINDGARYGITLPDSSIKKEENVSKMINAISKHQEILENQKS
jgi:hypothetical protein